MQTKSDDSLHITGHKMLHCCFIHKDLDKCCLINFLPHTKTLGVGVAVLLIYFDSH